MRLCRIVTTASRWQPADEHAERAISPEVRRWLAEKDLRYDLFRARVELSWAGCPSLEAASGADLVLLGGNPEANRVRLEPAALAQRQKNRR